MSRSSKLGGNSQPSCKSASVKTILIVMRVPFVRGVLVIPPYTIQEIVSSPENYEIVRLGFMRGYILPQEIINKVKCGILDVFDNHMP